jgi:hypothetical protein
LRIKRDIPCEGRPGVRSVNEGVDCAGQVTLNTYLEYSLSSMLRLSTPVLFIGGVRQTISRTLKQAPLALTGESGQRLGIHSGMASILTLDPNRVCPDRIRELKSIEVGLGVGVASANSLLTSLQLPVGNDSVPS